MSKPNKSSKPNASVTREQVEDLRLQVLRTRVKGGPAAAKIGVEDDITPTFSTNGGW